MLSLNAKTFAEAAASYLEKKPGQQKYVEQMLPYIGHRLLDEISPYDIRELAEQLYPTQSNSTRNRCVITPARAIYYHAYDRRWAGLTRIRGFKEDPPPRKNAATPVWMYCFIKQCEDDGLMHVAALVLFMAQTGARVSEAIRLEWSEVDLLNRTALLLKTKTETNSQRYLTDQLVSRLYELKEKSKPGQRVFRYRCRHSVNERIKEVCRRAEIDYKPSHTCGRHTMANTAMALGADIKSTMIAGGWKSIPVFLGIYVNPRNSGRSVADRFNAHQLDGQL